MFAMMRILIIAIVQITFTKGQDILEELGEVECTRFRSFKVFQLNYRGWSEKFATGLNIKIGIAQKI